MRNPTHPERERRVSAALEHTRDRGETERLILAGHETVERFAGEFPIS
jgi:hypothetical protein